MTMQQILDRVSTSTSLSYTVLNSANRVIITVEDFEGFDENYDEILVEVDEQEVEWACQFDGMTVDGWLVSVEYASEDI